MHNKKTIENISKYIQGSKSYYLQNFKSGKTLDKDFIGESFIQSELEEFKKIGDKYIKKVGIRN